MKKDWFDIELNDDKKKTLDFFFVLYVDQGSDVFLFCFLNGYSGTTYLQCIFECRTRFQ